MYIAEVALIFCWSNGVVECWIKTGILSIVSFF